VSIDLSSQRVEIEQVFKAIEDLAKQVDPTLSKTVASEATKAIKSLGYLEQKMLRAEKNNQDVGIGKLSKIKQRLFPGNNGLQERYDNFIGFYLRYGASWIDALINHADPLDKSFKVLVEQPNQ